MQAHAATDLAGGDGGADQRQDEDGNRFGGAAEDFYFEFFGCAQAARHLLVDGGVEFLGGHLFLGIEILDEVGRRKLEQGVQVLSDAHAEVFVHAVDVAGDVVVQSPVSGRAEPSHAIGGQDVGDAVRFEFFDADVVGDGVLLVEAADVDFGVGADEHVDVFFFSFVLVLPDVGLLKFNAGAVASGYDGVIGQDEQAGEQAGADEVGSQEATVADAGIEDGDDFRVEGHA